MITIIPYLVAVLLAIFDNSLASLVVILPLLLCSHMIVKKAYGSFLFNKELYFVIVSCVYLISSFIISNSFRNGKFHIVFDPSHYIADFINNKQYFNEGILETITSNYTGFLDNNILYHIMLTQISALGAEIGGTTIFTLTALQTGFGIMTCCMIYRILCRYTHKVFLYSLTYALFSINLFYSCVIIRDVIIAFFYIWAVNVVLNKYSIKGTFILLFIVFCTLGLRLYSGIFLLLILLYYIFSRLYHSKLKVIVLPVAISITIGICGYMLSSDLVDQATSELEIYSELSNENSEGGMVSKLMSLPPGISHVAVVLFSMIKPFPPHCFFLEAKSFSDYYMSIIYTLELWWWYLVFYITLIGVIYKRYYKYMGHDEICLFLITIIFLLMNSSHPDIRRMMPMFPIIYILYIKIKNQKQKDSWIKKYRAILVCCYVLLCFYVLIR